MPHVQHAATAVIRPPQSRPQRLQGSSKNKLLDTPRGGVGFTLGGVDTKSRDTQYPNLFNTGQLVLGLRPGSVPPGVAEERPTKPRACGPTLLTFFAHRWLLQRSKHECRCPSGQASRRLNPWQSRTSGMKPRRSPAGGRSTSPAHLHSHWLCRVGRQYSGRRRVIWSKSRFSLEPAHDLGIDDMFRHQTHRECWQAPPPRRRIRRRSEYRRTGNALPAQHTLYFGEETRDI